MYFWRIEILATEMVSVAEMTSKGHWKSLAIAWAGLDLHIYRAVMHQKGLIELPQLQLFT